MVGQSHERKEVIRVAVYCFTQLIQPGKREEAKAIFEEIRETRRSESMSRSLKRRSASRR